MPLSNVFEFKNIDVSTKKGVIFDLDGTLADSMGAWCDDKRWSGLNYRQMLAEFKKLYSEEVQPLPYVIKMLEALHAEGVPTCILSATPRDIYFPFVQRFGLDKLVMFCADCTEWNDSKDVPDPYYTAIDRLGLERDEVIIFEDYLPSVRTAAKAGLCVVGVYDSQSRDSMPEIKHLCTEYIYNFGNILKK